MAFSCPPKSNHLRKGSESAIVNFLVKPNDGAITTFAFIRYREPWEMNNAIQNGNGRRPDGFAITVRKATFGSLRDGRTYKEVLSSKPTPNLSRDNETEVPEICLNVEISQEENEWLKRSAVDSLISFVDHRILEEIFASEGFQSTVKPMGGSMVLITFYLQEDMDSCTEFFRELGNAWGSFISLDESTRCKKRLDVARVMVTVNKETIIPSKVIVKVNGKAYHLSISIDSVTELPQLAYGSISSPSPASVMAFRQAFSPSPVTAIANPHLHDKNPTQSKGWDSSSQPNSSSALPKPAVKVYSPITPTKSPNQDPTPLTRVRLTSLVLSPSGVKFQQLNSSLDGSPKTQHKENQSRGNYDSQAADAFASFINAMELVDLPLTSSSFTWTDNRDYPIMCRLDRFLITSEFLQICPSVIQKSHPRSLSDHNPISLESHNSSWGPKPFRLFSHWLDYKEFTSFVNNSWKKISTDKNITSGLFDQLKSLKIEMRLN
ncbi:Uncharacterized protein TCM_033956 [Theobroma cacao]|uniref:Uncharacterized protein n=1 Tax=Theobroma cacao TaxID=3641 RepID=A0A061FCL7_THECC|nr:Uncharacterized protein TCM_033956 [Theobroma cacao]